jgi:dTDP-4-dehydrorhamnose reductase
MFNKYVSKIIPYLLDEKGIINIGGKKRDILNFANKFSDKKIKSINFKEVSNFPKNSSIEIKKLKKILKKNCIKKIIF